MGEVVGADAAARGGSSAREWALVWSVLTFGVLIAYFPVTIGSESFYHHDRYSLHVPFWQTAWDSIADGHFPFWTASIRAGYPLLANGEASVLYPFTYLFTPFFPAHRALDLFTLFHLVIGGGSCYLYLRRLTNHEVLALTGALAFSLSGRLCGMTIWGHAVAATVYLPLLLWAIDRKSLVVMALAIGLGALTGRPQVHVLTVLLGATYAAFRVIQAYCTSGKPPWSHSLAVFGGFAFGVCLGCVQILPTVAFVRESTRAGGTELEEWLSFSNNIDAVPGVLLPGPYQSGWPEACSYATVFVYCGICIGLIRLLLDRRHARAETLFWLTLAVLSAYVAFAGPGAYTVLQELPLLRSFRVPARFLHVAWFGGLVIGVLGWHGLRSRRRRWALLLLGIVLVDGTITTLASLHTIPSSAYEQTHRYVAELQSSTRDETGSVRRYHADVLWIPPSDFAGQDRVAVDRMFAAIPPTPNLASLHGLRCIKGHGEPLFSWYRPESFGTTIEMHRQLGVEYLFVTYQTDDPRLQPLGPVGGKWSAYRMLSPGPRARVIEKIYKLADSEQTFAAASAPQFDQQNTAIVEARAERKLDQFRPPDPTSDPDATSPGTSPGSSSSSSVRMLADTPNRVVLQARSTKPAYLLLFDTWAPGWTASVNGSEQPILRANGLFRLVRIPSGTSTVEFTYMPPGFIAGLWLGIVGVLGLVLTSSLSRSRRSYPPPTTQRPL